MNSFRKKILPMVLGVLSVGGNICFNSSAMKEKATSQEITDLANRFGLEEKLINVKKIEYRGHIDVDSDLGGHDTYTPLVTKNPGVVFYRNKNNELVNEYNQRLDLDGNLLLSPSSLGSFVGWHVRDKIELHPLAAYLNTGRNLDVKDSDKMDFYNCYAKSGELLVLDRASRKYELISEGVEKARTNPNYICDFWLDVKNTDVGNNKPKPFPWARLLLAEAGVLSAMGTLLFVGVDVIGKGEKKSADTCFDI